MRLKVVLRPPPSGEGLFIFDGVGTGAPSWVAATQSYAARRKPSDHPTYPIGGLTASIFWSELQDTAGQVRANNRLDTVLAEALAGGWKLKLRLFTNPINPSPTINNRSGGVPAFIHTDATVDKLAPAYDGTAETPDGPSGSGMVNQDNQLIYPIVRWWGTDVKAAAYRAAYSDLIQLLADRYIEHIATPTNPDGTIVCVTIGVECAWWTESGIRMTTTSTGDANKDLRTAHNRAMYTAAGYTLALDYAAMQAGITAHATHWPGASCIEFNPWQNPLTGANDLAQTLTAIDYFVAAGPRGTQVLGNDSARSSATFMSTGAGDYKLMYAHMLTHTKLGVPLHFETALEAVILADGTWADTLGWSEMYRTSMVELMPGWDSEIATGTGPGQFAHWNRRVVVHAPRTRSVT